MQRRQIQVWLPLLLSLFMVAGMFVGYRMRDGMPGKSFFFKEQPKPLQEIIDLIEKKYVDPVPVDSITDTAIYAILNKLDPHSIYIPAEELEQVNEGITGSFFGVGIEFNIFDDTLHVINVLKDGPAFKAGIKTGDKFLKAGDSIISGKKMSAERIRKILRGNRGSIVNIDLLRGKNRMMTSITRDVIPLTSIDAAYMIDKEIGYIRINKFSQQTYLEFMKSLESLKGNGMKKLVLDLRDNGGGVLDGAIEIADELLDGDRLITYTEGKHSPKKEYRCRRNGQFEKGKLAILADEGTASASEVLIGALQDWDRATIIGRRTFGKGLVQEQYDLADGSALRLTVSRYYTPMGRSIQRSYSSGEKAYFDEISDRFSDGEIFSADSARIDTTRIYHSKNGKILYGGGGISPDIFVPGDSGRIGTLTTRLYLSGIINDFGYEYLMRYPQIETRFNSPKDFAANFSIDNEGWVYFKSLAAADSIKTDTVSVNEKSYLLQILKRSVARQIWRNEGFFQVLNEDDKTVGKALEILRKEN